MVLPSFLNSIPQVFGWQRFEAEKADGEKHFQL
jgi:hypothetical protein